jgi:hypothetical protein
MRGRVHLFLFLFLFLPCLAQQPVGLTPDSLVLKDFSRRVADYVKLHKAAQSEIHALKPTGSQEAIKRHEHQLAERIRADRQGATQGNLFTTEIAQEFRRLIGITMQGPQAARIRQSLQSVAPVGSQAIRIDSTYPAGLPLQSTPASLLLNLPPLPPEIEYRVMGHALVLRDVDANLVVDFIPNAIP